jgi:hypothetical protein
MIPVGMIVTEGPYSGVRVSTRISGLGLERPESSWTLRAGTPGW